MPCECVFVVTLPALLLQKDKKKTNPQLSEKKNAITFTLDTIYAIYEKLTSEPFLGLPQTVVLQVAWAFLYLSGHLKDQPCKSLQVCENP